MQTLIQVVCSEKKSLRDVIAHDERLKKFNFYVEAKQKPGRSPGWAKIHSVDSKGTGKPANIIGDFTKYLLSRFSKKIQSVIIVPR